MTEEENKIPALHHAASISTVKEVEQLIADGADIKERDDDGNTALHWAAGGFKTAHARVLINAGVDVFACNNDKDTAFNLATELHGYKNELANCLYEAMKKRGGKYWKKAEEELSKLE